MNPVAWAGALLMMVTLQVTDAQAFPTKPVRVFAGSNPGAPGDLSGRLVAAPLSEMWKQQVIVENRPSAGGDVAGEIVSRAPADGYTLLVCSLTSHALGPAVQKNRPFDHIRDFAPISRIGMLPYVLIVHPSLPVKSNTHLPVSATCRI
jgi:tripartite-type tricarboxylate transporter receptor subunit TctC